MSALGLILHSSIPPNPSVNDHSSGVLIIRRKTDFPCRSPVRSKDDVLANELLIENDAARTVVSNEIKSFLPGAERTAETRLVDSENDAVQELDHVAARQVVLSRCR
jgi:hypothetical protein